MAGKILEPQAPATEPVAEANETKAETFKRLANKRVTVALDKLRLIGNLSSTGNYEYTEEQVERIRVAIQNELDTVIAKFKPRAACRERSFEL